MWQELLLAFIFLKEINTGEVYTIQNLQVNHLIDVSTYIVKDKFKIIFQNIGNLTVDEYSFELQGDVAFLNFMNSNNETLAYEIQNQGKEWSTCIVKLDKPVFSNEKYILKVKLIQFWKLLPATELSSYNEDHSFKLRGNILFKSKYHSISCRCMFLTNPSFNKNIKFSVMHDAFSRNKYIYATKNVKPHSERMISMTFSSAEPRLLVKKLERRIYISHYGKIIIEDNVVVYNGGPKLKGPYFKTKLHHWMFTHLPSSADNIKFFDAIGNSSKTMLYHDEGRQALKFIPRYSLRQGGWKSTYTLRYCVPVYEYIYREENNFYLKIRALDHIINDAGIEEVDVTIILPEGAIVETSVVPIGFEKVNTTYHDMSLSFFKREIIKLRGKFLVEEHINDITIKYQYSIINWVRAPLHIIFLLECLFLVFILVEKNSDKFSL